MTPTLWRRLLSTFTEWRARRSGDTLTLRVAPMSGEWLTVNVRPEPEQIWPVDWTAMRQLGRERGICE